MMAKRSRRYRRAKTWYLLTRHGNNFLGSQWGGGALLVLFSVIALVLANLGATKHFYHELLGTEIGVHINNFRLFITFEEWVNDALMAVFFFVVGLEIKREIIAGELSSVKHATLPAVAALGGMIVPALIYFLINHGSEF